MLDERRSATTTGLTCLGEVELALGVGIAAQRLIGATEVVVRLNETGRQDNGALQDANGIIISLKIQVELPQSFVAQRVVRINFNRALEVAHGVVNTVLLEVGRAEVVSGGEICGIEFQRALEGTQGALDVLHLHLRQSQIISGQRKLGIELQGGLEVL